MKKLIVLLLCLVVGLIMSCQQQTTADDVINMVTEASGGAAKLAEIQDQVSTWELTMHIMTPGMPEGMEGPMSMPMTMRAGFAYSSSALNDSADRSRASGSSWTVAPTPVQLHRIAKHPR